MNEFTIVIAFTAGFVSFLSPCVLPLIPGFLAYLAGGTVSESGTNRLEIFLNSVFFVLGFSIIFAVLGVLLNSVLSQSSYEIQLWLSRIGGVLIIFFGLYLVGAIKLSFLEKEHKFSVKKKFNSRYATSFIFGSAFAVGWTPCVGAVLGGILGLASAQPGSALSLLFSYSLGLGIPFLLVGLFVSQADSLIRKYAFVAKYITIVFGYVLIILGILVFTQQINRIASFEYLINLVF